MTAPEPIAIIGTGCRFPGASSSPARLWKLLQNPRDVSSKVPADRFNIDAFYHHDGSHHGTTNVREAYFLSEDVRLFDASFFNVSAREAEAIDPQQRLLMETVYEAVEAAGLRLEDLQGSSTGVFCGVMRDDYGSILFRDPGALPQYAATGTGRSILSNRISYFFDWHGPSITLDTACSSSLVAVHLAAKALLDGDCPVAIAAGTNLILDPDMFISEAKLNMLSPSGRSHMWDAMADGYAAGEGVAAIVLKRLSDAIADGDCIECIIKATNINQDGRSLGITMPSSTAQTRLIRSTYEKAGLDLARPEDRCQYFEAHGTGTPAGDPEEANAIHAAFFSSGSTEDARGKLYVGSIKTVVGHTEGTAGLAGLIKASLSIQRGVIPPNMHFESVNPKIAPLTSRLRVPTDPLPWPALPPGVPRRASVNSFGFGGTNAHVILEAYSPPAAVVAMAEGPVVLPFTFSAHTDKILGSVLERHAAYVRQHPETDPRRLAWSLSRRRSVFTHKISFSAPSLQALLAQIDAELQLRKEGKATTVVSRIGAGSKSLLGVFTGQGAQWPQMGLDLVSASPAAEASFRAMQVALDELPPQYQSDFSLVRELSAPKSESRLDRAVVSQPLCTAIQIVLVDFLHTLGIRFAAVAGHSSGEIACAYAAGVITAVDAIRIAYLRGFFAKLAGADGKPGAMLAAGLAPDEARDICKQPKFAGKIALAACNSPSSVTLSGDVEAIKEVELLLKGQEKFARLVKVDTAYHSHHMLPCAEPYVQALEACNVRPRPPSGTRWFSSVLDGQEIGAAHCDLFKAQYWKDNMVNTVLFSQALGAAVEGMEALDLAVEVGPHPALKGPALQTISEARETANELPYFGLLSRGSSGVGAFSSAVGALWAHVGARSLDLGSYTRLFQGTESTSYLEGLPSYPFDRSQSYWCEARSSKARTHRKEPPNQLLGVPTTDVAEGEWRWTNYLRRSEIEWLDGHRIQSQTVFPATGYVAMALEAVSIAAGAKSLCSVEVLDFSIGRAISFGDDTTGVETLFLLEDLHMEEDGLSASFTCHANFGGTLTRCASGTVQVAFGKQDIAALSRRAEQSRGMRNIDVDEFYSSLEELGYGYTGLFRGITSLMRKKDAASGHLSNAAVVNHGSPLLLHPALTDTVLQAMLATVGLPGDGRLYTLMVPTQISRISINPLFCGPRQAQLGDQLAFDANLTSLSQGGATGDAHLYDNNGHGIVHMEGIRVSELMAPLPADDRLLFAEVSWGCLEPDAAAAYAKVSPERVELADSQSWADHKERTALYYLKTIVAQLTPEDRERFSWHQRTLVAWMERTLSQTMAGKHPTCKAEWLMDTLDDVLRDEARYPPLVDHQLYNAIGRGCLPFLRGEGTILEELRDSGLLIDVYRLGVDFLPLNNHVGELAAQLAFKYPHMKILEIGAGTGSVTQCVIDRLGHRYHSYTFTDISAGFFDDAEARFAEHSNLFVYRVLDIEKDALQQNFKEHEYDLIIAANVLHATQPLKDTMTRVRTLLKPGGHLLMLEGTRPEEVALTFCFGAFEGWWRGESDKRRSGPMMKPAQWDALLRDTGFSGVEAITPNHEKSPRTFSVMMTQAVDDTINQLRSPLTFIERVPKYDELIIVGGTTPTTRSLVADLKPILSNYFRRVLESASLNSLDLRSSSVVTVLNLADLDSPCLRDITAGCYASLQRLMDAAKTVLWVSGDPEEDPYQGMSRAMLSCLGYENPYSRFQHLSVSHRDTPTAHLLATMLLRLTKTDFENDHKFPKLSWATEGELKLEGGKLYVPRICHSKPLNDRYRADRRKIRNPVDIRRSAVKLVDSGSAYDFVEEVGEESSIADGIRIKVTHSTLAASRVKGVGFLHLVLGRALDTQAQLLALTESHASITTAPPCWVVPCSVPEGQEAGFLSMVVCSLLADYISDVAERNSAVLVYGANPMLTRAITDRSFVKGIHAYFDAGLPNDSSESSSVHHKMRSALSPKFSIPKNVSAIVQLCKDSSRIPARVASLVPKYVNRLSLGDMYSDSSVVPPYSDMSKASESLRVAYLSAGPALSLTAQVGTFHVLQADEIPNFSHTASGLQIVEWTKTTHVPVAVQTASSMLRLSSNKTYLLAGMTGDTGRSICQWMIERGARNVVLTSRSPKVDRWWIDEMAAAGAKVAAMSMDVTEKSSILAVHAAIQKDYPPVGGVVNGAMVLRDGFFNEMTRETMQSIFNPKVRGSILLSELYSDANLEFFILFGSIAAASCTIGQSAYAAANAFMCALARQRKNRGLVGSIVCPGEIRGMGYVVRENAGARANLQEYLKTDLGSQPSSEQDIHEMFAEAIFAGHPSSSANPELISGLHIIQLDENTRIPWWRNTKFWSFIDHSLASTVGVSTTDALPVKAQLVLASSQTEASEIIEGAFIAKLRKKLQLQADDVLTRETLLVELGVDSLVAVNLRSWFVKELDVNMPVLKILGGSSIGDLVDDALEMIPEIGSTQGLDPDSPLLAEEKIPDVPGSLPETQVLASHSSSQTPSESHAAYLNSLATPVRAEERLEPEPASLFPATNRLFVPELSRATSMTSLIANDSASDSHDKNSSDTSYTSDAEVGPIKVKYKKIEKLSYAQSRYFFLNNYLEDKTTHNVTLLVRFRASPRISDLELAVRTVGARHEALRTCYLAGTDELSEAHQAILPTSRFHLEKCQVKDEAEARQEYYKVRDHIYDLANGENARIRLVTVAPDMGFLILGCHHACLDSVSIHMVLGELETVYMKQTLPRVTKQYSDLSAGQRAAYEHGKMEKELTYWRSEFRDLPEPIPLLPMASARSRQALKQYDTEELSWQVNNTTVAKIKAACKKARSTPFHFYLSVLRIFLVRMAEAEDVCIGVADANRSDPDNANVVGLLLNLLPMRFRSNDIGQAFRLILNDTRSKAHAALHNSSVPFDKLLDQLRVPRSAAHSPLFQVFMDWQPQSKKFTSFGGVQAEVVESLPGKTGYDITLLITEASDGETTVNFRLQKSLYSGRRAELLAASYMNLVNAFADNVELVAKKAPLYDSIAMKHSAGLGKGRIFTSNWPSTISRRVDEVVASRGPRLAVKDGEGTRLTYSQLNARSNDVVAALIGAGVHPGSPVCLFQHPTAEWICCMLAIWKLNAVYVPLDLRNPLPRILAQIQDCQPHVILCHDQTRAEAYGLDFSSAKTINSSEIQSGVGSADVENKSEAQSPAVILYTSGSTGKPKGLILRHSGIRNQVEGYSSEWQLGAETVLQQGAMTFNHSLDQMLLALSNGGCVYVVPRSIRGDPVSLSKLVADENITYTKATPSEYANWLRYGSESLRKATNWKFAFGGGEHFTTTLAQSFRALNLPNLRLFNSYGPGEITISSHKTEIPYKQSEHGEENIYPVGFSLPNYATYIVDKEMNLLPQGVSGEILIGGAGPCIGYLNQESLTDEKWIENPFASPEFVRQGWVKAYRTFDRGHFGSDGALVIEGRLDGDTQIKLRGIRMELEDIENTILKEANGTLTGVVVSLRGQETQFLAAHVVFSSNIEGDEKSGRDFLKQLTAKLPLPQYMRPSIMVPMDKFPLNVHGKIDRKAVNTLPLPKASQNTTSDTGLTAFESELREIWTTVFDEAVDISSIVHNTDFFLVGGNSVLLVQVQAIVREKLGVSLPLIELFEATSLGEMADRIQFTAQKQAIDWSAETSIGDIAAQLNSVKRVHYTVDASEKPTIVLTGASGFLGNRILRKLISEDSVAHIHAIAVRPDAHGGRCLGISSPKITVHYGDLKSPLLGLSREEFNQLASSADLIIHSGANRSFWDTYHMLREANVVSTKTLISLASRRHMPVHFLSSGAVDDLDTPPVDGTNGYVASKWASEKLLENAARQLGVPAIIHRPVEAADAQESPDHILEEFAKQIEAMRCVPIEGGWNGTFSLIPAATIVDAMVERAISAHYRMSAQDAAGNPELVFHEASIRVRTESIISSRLQDAPEYRDFERLPAVKWLGRAKKEGFEYLVATQDAVVGGNAESRR